MGEGKEHFESTVSAGSADAQSSDVMAETVRAPETLARGRQLGRYTIEGLLGEGGMGAVYEAVHRDLQKRVAVKTLHRRISGSPEVRARFLREGQAASRIRHEHVVDIYDVGMEGDVPYLVMEYLEGESLAALLAREPRLPVQRIADIMVPVASALAAAHARGIVHRDLKPDNIYLCDGPGAPQPKVLDFGISKIVDEGTQNAHALTGTSAMLGTPFYMSPEQAQDAKSIDARTDQYSLGVILYEAATGERPFGDQTLYSLLNKIVEGKFAAPQTVAPDLPERFCALILRAMARNQEDRFESIAAFGQALLEFASDRTRMLHSDGFGTQPKPASHPDGASRALTPPAQLSYPGSTTTLGAGTTQAPQRRPSTLAAAIAGALALGGLVTYFATRSTEAANVAPARTEAAADSSHAAEASVPAAPRAPSVVPIEAPPASAAPAGPSASTSAAIQPRAAQRGTPHLAAPPHPTAPKLAPR